MGLDLRFDFSISCTIHIYNFGLFPVIRKKFRILFLSATIKNRPNQWTHTACVPVILVLGEGVVVMVMDPLLFQSQSLDLQLCALGLLHGLQLMGCRHRTSEGGRLGQVTERST